MALIALKCPNCNGDIQLDDEREFGFCLYCGSKVLLTEKINQKVSIDESEKAASLVKIANGFFNDGVNDKALDFVNKALELDPENADAWFIRGMCSEILVDKRTSLSTAINMGLSPESEKLAKAELDNICDQVEVTIINNIMGLPVQYIVIVDGREVPSPDGKAVVRLTKGKHRFGAKASIFGAGSGENTFDVQKDSRIILSAGRSLFSIKINVTME